MKTFIVIMILMAATKSHSWELPIIEVLDGDTIKTRIDGLPPELRSYSVRIYGIDTPEKGWRASCPEENDLALKAHEFTHKLLKNHETMDVSACKHDKYGGRIDCIVHVNGINVGNALIAKRYARPYYGDKKESWCNK